MRFNVNEAGKLTDEQFLSINLDSIAQSSFRPEQSVMFSE